MRDERVGTAQRTQVIEALSRALGEGYLTLEEYDHRVVAVGSATYASELLGTVQDMPPEFGWDPRPVPPPPGRPARFARTALVLGVVSLPSSVCLLGAVFGVAAIAFSVPGGRGAGPWSPAMIGRVLGAVGIALSAAVLIALLSGPRTG
jgi:Domain of unknown function (DUF1707)